MKGLTSIAAQQIAPFCAFRWLLSGTPVTNSPADLYTQLSIVRAGDVERTLGKRDSFLASAEVNPARVSDAVTSFVLRRTKEQCLDLPDKTFIDIRVELAPWQRRMYDEMRDHMVCEIRSMSGPEYRAFASTALAQLTRLAQIASNPGLLGGGLTHVPAKFEALDGLLADILSVQSRKVIVWSNYVKTIETLVSRYHPYGAVAIYGNVPTPDRQDIAVRFQNDPSTRVLIANPAAAGTGFTLTAASFTIYESLSWRYDFYAQSQDRNHRIGQSLPVTYLRLIASDTIEELIASTLERKTAMAASLLGDPNTGANFSDLTKDDMCELLLRNRLPHA